MSNFSDLPQGFGTNQHLDVGDEVRDNLRAVLRTFRAPVRFAFAYGSGVFPQKGYAKAAKPMVDFIFGVSYADHFHALNLTHNFDHYSFLRRLGSGAISHVQRAYGAGVYFNPYVRVNGQVIKYGVVTIDDLCADLESWQTLYLAGRMHKPVKILRDHPQVRLANQRNLYSAIRTALLLLPESFSERELYATIGKISYMGDPRMAFGENPRKVENIVAAQLDHFRRLYAPFLELLPNVAFTSTAGAEEVRLQQNLDPVKRGNMVRRLPEKFRSLLYYQYRRRLGSSARLAAQDDPSAGGGAGGLSYGPGSTYGNEFDRQIATDPDLPAEVSKAIKATVSWPSTSQSIKGILTAGPVKSWSYVGEKLGKARTRSKGKMEDDKQEAK